MVKSAGWSPREGPPEGVTPDAVVFDHESGPHSFYLAGFYRGKGVPVVFVGDVYGSAYRLFASRTGAISLLGADQFRTWLLSRPDYLRRAESIPVKPGGGL